MKQLKVKGNTTDMEVEDEFGERLATLEAKIGEEDKWDGGLTGEVEAMKHTTSQLVQNLIKNAQFQESRLIIVAKHKEVRMPTFIEEKNRFEASMVTDSKVGELISETGLLGGVFGILAKASSLTPQLLDKVRAHFKRDSYNAFLGKTQAQKLLSHPVGQLARVCEHATSVECLRALNLNIRPKKGETAPGAKRPQIFWPNNEGQFAIKQNNEILVWGSPNIPHFTLHIFIRDSVADTLKRALEDKIYEALPAEAVLYKVRMHTNGDCSTAKGRKL